MVSTRVSSEEIKVEGRVLSARMSETGRLEIPYKFFEKIRRMKAPSTPDQLPRGLTWNFIHSCKANTGSVTCNFEDCCTFDQGLPFQLLASPNP
jgi:hypothetical protein